MAVNNQPKSIAERWYDSEKVFINDQYVGQLSKEASSYQREWQQFESGMRERTRDFPKLQRVADGLVVTERRDLPNISSGESAGLIRRIARNVVQNTPNVTVISKFDAQSAEGVLATYLLKNHVLASTRFGNQMQQYLVSSTEAALTFGFACVVPVLEQDAMNQWYVRYDRVHYSNVFPDPGVLDIRDSHVVYVRRHLSATQIKRLIETKAPGWQLDALNALLKAQYMSYTGKQKNTAMYEVVTRYTDDGSDFITFIPATGYLLRVEKNRHPSKQHPVFFLVVDMDGQSPLGRSQVRLLFGRQEFQDLMLNGYVKMVWRNINPPIMVYGMLTSAPNLTPGSYNHIQNPNTRIEPFEINTSALANFGNTSQQNLGSMINLVGAADPAMAQSSSTQMSATPQGVEAQARMVDITTNNFQKAVEAFFEQYCSYGLNLLVHELKAEKNLTPNAETRQTLVNSGMPPSNFDDSGMLKTSFKDLECEYKVVCVPGSLAEMEDAKQLRILKELYVPLSQALPALTQSPNPAVGDNASMVMQFIMERILSMSGSVDAEKLSKLMRTGNMQEVNIQSEMLSALENRLSEVSRGSEEDLTNLTEVVAGLQSQISQILATQQNILDGLGAISDH